jgi:hypothetical protein
MADEVLIDLDDYLSECNNNRPASEDTFFKFTCHCGDSFDQLLDRLTSSDDPEAILNGSEFGQIKTQPYLCRVIIHQGSEDRR